VDCLAVHQHQGWLFYLFGWLFGVGIAVGPGAGLSRAAGGLCGTRRVAVEQWDG
jgi:hypothetical protein